MSGEHVPYEIFLSYARKDDVPAPVEGQGWVAALHDQILADHRRFSTEPLRIFYDTRAIRDMDDWRHRILGALRSSKILLVCLSPNYAASEFCHWEWEEYTRRQVHQHMGGDSVAAIYFAELPGAAPAEIAAWLTAVQRGNFTDIRPWFPEGSRALQREDVRRRMAALGQSLWERIERTRRAEKAPGNLRRQAPYFVGRREELRCLHEQLATGAVGLVTAVHGLGGQGKTELAVTYGHAYAHDYPAGLWLLPAQGKKELLPLVGELAFAPELDYRPNDKERADGNLLGRAVLAELGRRAAGAAAKEPERGSAALLILDNVSEPALLSQAELAKLPRAEFLRIVATTRLGSAQLASPASSLAFVEVGSLQEEDALALIREHQPPRDSAGREPAFASPAEETAARAIVRELGGLTLAVEQVAVHLGLHPEIAPSAYLAGLRRRGLASTDRHAPEAGASMQHQEKQLSLVLEETLAPLSPGARTALAFAAHLPPDCVPWPWLRSLTLARHPDLGQHEPDEPDPWLTLRRELEGLRLLAPGDSPEIGRMHRLVGAHLAAGSENARLEQDVARHIVARTWAISGAQKLDAPWELDSLLVALPTLLVATRLGDVQGDVANAAVSLSDRVIACRNLASARALLDLSHPLLERRAARDPSNASWQRDLSASHNFVGGVQLMEGDLDGALVSHRKSLAIAEQLAARDPSNATCQELMCECLHRMGIAQFLQLDREGALVSLGRSVAIAERLIAADPSNTTARTTLSAAQFEIGMVQEVQQDKVGALGSFLKSDAMAAETAAPDASNTASLHSLFLAQLRLGTAREGHGDLAGALESYQNSMVLAERLAAADATTTIGQLGLLTSQLLGAGVQRRQGDLDGALESYRNSMVLAERLAAADTSNAIVQQKLQEAQSQVGEIQQSQGDLEGAIESHRKSLAICERLVATNPGNTLWQMSLLMSHEKVGDVQREQGNLAGALESYRKSTAISERLVATDPSNAWWQGVLSASHATVGDVHRGQGDLSGALESYQKSLAIIERLAASDASNAEWQNQLYHGYLTVGDVHRKQGDLSGALESYRKSLAIFERLAASDASNAEWQQEVSVSHRRVADVQRGQEDLEGALASYRTGLAILERLAASDPGNAEWQQDLSLSHEKVGEVQREQGNLAGTLASYRKSVGILEQLVTTDPSKAELPRTLSVSHHRVGGHLSRILCPRLCLLVFESDLKHDVQLVEGMGDGS